MELATNTMPGSQYFQKKEQVVETTCVGAQTNLHMREAFITTVF